MDYEIQAKAIRYGDVVFRSMLECQCYLYLKRLTPSLSISYEPPVTFNHLWNPDFELRESGVLKFLIEVKPNSERFDVLKYLVLCQSVQCGLLCMDYHNVYEFEKVGFKVYPHNDLLWKSAWNEMKKGGENA